MDIKQIYFLVREEEIRYMYVFFEDFRVKRIKYSNKANRYLKQFQEQESKSQSELEEDGMIVYYPCTKENFSKLNKLTNACNNYVKLHEIEDGVTEISLLFSGIEILTNHLITYDAISSKIFVPMSFVSIGLPILFMGQIHFEKKFIPKKVKFHNLKVKALLLLSCLTLLDSMHLPQVSTMPYYYEILNTDIDDTNNYDGLSDDEYHVKAINTIFNNLHNNPYLSEEDYNTLMSLKQYALDNPYLDCNKLFHDMLTLRIYDKYNLGTISGSCIYDDNIIYCYPNHIEDGFRNVVIEHEMIHKTGCLNNRVLDEGMTALLQREYFKEQPVYDAYGREVICVRLMCEIIGSDKMLEAYSTCDDSLIYDSLTKIYGNKAVVDGIYKLMNSYTNCCDISVDDKFRSLYLTLINEAQVNQNDIYDRLMTIDLGKDYFNKESEKYYLKSIDL